MPVPLPAAIAERRGQRTGLRVVEVVPGSPAGLAGIYLGDVIVTAGDRAVSGVQDLQRLMLGRAIGALIRSLRHQAPAAALERLARVSGFDATLYSGTGDPAAVDDSDAAVVVASHGHGEEEALGTALESAVPYVGLVASPRRGAARLSGKCQLHIARAARFSASPASDRERSGRIR